MRKRPPQDSQPDPILALLIGGVSGGVGTGAYLIYTGVRGPQMDTFSGSVETDLLLGTGLGMGLASVALLAKHLRSRTR